jgi:hypothetical protein
MVPADATDLKHLLVISDGHLFGITEPKTTSRP